MFSYLNKKLEEEYIRVSLWYFVSFLFGCAFYFSYQLLLTNNIYSLICSIIIILLIALLKLDLLWRFLAYLICMFLLGSVVAHYRYYSIVVNVMEQPQILTLEGSVESIKPTTKGISVVLTNIESDISQELTKVKISILEKYNNDFFINDRINIRVKLFKPQNTILPGSYDFSFYSHFAEISATGYAMSAPVVIRKQKK